MYYLIPSNFILHKKEITSLFSLSLFIMISISRKNKYRIKYDVYSFKHFFAVIKFLLLMSQKKRAIFYTSRNMRTLLH